MRQIAGGRVVEVSAAEFAQRRGRFRGLLLDVGTGDGKHARVPSGLIVTLGG